MKQVSNGPCGMNVMQNLDYAELLRVKRSANTAKKGFLVLSSITVAVVILDILSYAKTAGSSFDKIYDCLSSFDIQNIEKMVLVFQNQHPSDIFESNGGSQFFPEVNQNLQNRIDLFGVLVLCGGIAYMLSRKIENCAKQMIEKRDRDSLPV